MKPDARSRVLRAVAVIVAALALAVAPATAAFAGGPAPDVPGAPGFVGGTQDFTFDSFDGVYELSRDDSKRSHLRVTETLVAAFPDFDQNHGILRAIPTTYDGHPVQIDVDSATDENGNDYPLESSFEDGNIILQVGDPDVYLQGTHTFVITYTMKDVTRYFPDTGDDEFYWDTNGLLWQQPFGSVTAHVVLGDGLADALNGNAACYFGSEGSSTPCDITQTDTGFDASAQQLGAFQNMTVAIGFTKGTFAPAAFDLFAYIPVASFIGLVASIGGAILAFILRFTALRGARGTGIVVAQYEPDESISALLAANLVNKPKKGMAASIVDLAVRRKIKIVEKPAEGFLAHGTTFGVQQVNESDLSDDDERVMSALFATTSIGFLSQLLRRGGGASTPGIITIGQQLEDVAESMSAGSAAVGPTGEVRWLIKKDQILGQQVVAITKAVAAEAKARKLRKNPPALPVAIVAILVIVGFLLLLIGSINAQSDVGITLGVFGSIGSAWLGVGALIMLGGQRPLTKEGALAVEHLEGLREYIRLAEADRLQMLQSVTGAERTKTTGQPDVVKIYERLLPYAVIFGLEKEWAGELAKYYDTTPPDWYDGNVSAFSVGAFASSIGSLSSSVSTSFSGSSSSSSSGGSSGGGSSGGGGGGGGGGGF